LGHATRCIPIINALIETNFTPIIASDGIALEFLKKEFPKLKFYKLPGYAISYSKKSKWFKFHLLLKTPTLFSAVIKEHEIVQKIIEKEQILGIISDNRFGVYSKKVPSVYITHQLKVFSGSTTWLTSKIHQKIIQKFEVCWIPDVASKANLSGALSRIKFNKIPIKYLGVLSRFNKKDIQKKYGILVLLSGVEPQRTLFENKLIKELSNFKGNVLLVRGILKESKIKTASNFTVVNYLLAAELEKAILQSSLVIARSGYSTIMDLAVLNANAFFIPTPGLFEQEYLAKYLFEKYEIPFVKQDNFKLATIKNANKKCEFGIFSSKINLEIFSLFQRK